MASNENFGENSNTSRSENYDEMSDKVQVNPMVLLVRIKHVDGRPIEPEMLTEETFRELCQYANPDHKPFAIEILSPHEICITYRQGVSLGQVAGELMAVESWRDFPILITVVIIKRSKVDSIVEVRQKYRQERRDQEKLKQGLNNYRPFHKVCTSSHNIQPESSHSCQNIMGTLLCPLWFSRKDIVRSRSQF